MFTQAFAPKQYGKMHTIFGKKKKLQNKKEAPLSVAQLDGWQLREAWE